MIGFLHKQNVQEATDFLLKRASCKGVAAVSLDLAELARGFIVPSRWLDPWNPYDIPDWADPEAYPTEVELTIGQWRWEFIRRSEKYRSAWTGWRELYRDLDVDGCLEGAIVDEFGIGAPIDPRLEAREIENQSLIDYRANFIYWNDIDEHLAEELFEEQDLPDAVDELKFGRPSSLNDFVVGSRGSVLISIDPSRPLSSQFKNAEVLIQKDLAALGELFVTGSKPLRRRHAQKYQTYLRVLDARDVSQANRRKPVPWNALQAALRKEKHGVTARSLHTQATEVQQGFLHATAVRTHLLTNSGT